MGLRSLFPCAAADAAATSVPYCPCHMMMADAYLMSAYEHSIRRPPPSSTSPASAPQSRPCHCGEWRQPQLAWQWDTVRQHPEVRIDAQPPSATPAETHHHQRHRVIFHPTYSAGTAVVRSDRPLVAGEINYFEVKVLTPMTGTDMVRYI